GEVPSLAAINRLRPGDFRAFLARRAQDGIERGSLARGLSVLRGFLRFLQRRGLADTAALAALRSPKLPRSIPKPLTIEDAAGSLDVAAEVATRQWEGKRDRAVLALLYGCGLRLSEALGLTRSEARPGQLLAITRQGRQAAPAGGLAGGAAGGCRLSRRLPSSAGQGRSAVCRPPRRAAQPAGRAAANGGAAGLSRVARNRDPARLAPQLCNPSSRG